MLLATASPYSPYVPPVQRRFDFAPRPLVAPPALARWWVRNEHVLGSAVHIELWCEQPRAGAGVAAAALEEIQRVHRLLAPHSAASELARINREAAHHAVALSAEMTHLLGRGLALAQWSGGALAITNQTGGWQQLVLCEQRRTVRFLCSGLRLVLDGLVQGHAADQACAVLAARGVQHAVVAVGDSRRVLGTRQGRPWQVVVAAQSDMQSDMQSDLQSEVQSEVQSDMRGDVRGDVQPAAQPPAAQPPAAALTVQLQGGRAISTARGATSHPQQPSLLCATAMAGDALTSSAVCQAVQGLGSERGLALASSLPGVQAWACQPVV
jgi:FAD:protein FMN transferase